MVLDLKGFLNGGNRSLDIDTSIDYSGEEYRACNPFPYPVRVKGSVKNKADITRLDAVCSVIVRMPCDRCGRETEKEINVSVNRILVSSVQGEDDGSFLVLPDEKLDLYVVCLEEIILSFPTKFLCSEDCKGVCTVCGKNLNDGNCDCEN